jgi:hypothetical protein
MQNRLRVNARLSAGAAVRFKATSSEMKGRRAHDEPDVRRDNITIAARPSASNEPQAIGLKTGTNRSIAGLARVLGGLAT